MVEKCDWCGRRHYNHYVDWLPKIRRERRCSECWGEGTIVVHHKKGGIQYIDCPKCLGTCLSPLPWIELW